MIRKILILIYVLLVQVSYAVECNSKFNCSIVLDNRTQLPTKDIKCTLPNMPNMPIKAENVFDSNGNLKTHWNSQSVCDVLEWMNEATPKLSEVDGIATSFTVPITLKFKPQPGNRSRSALYATDNSITFDTDSFVEGNDFAYVMKYMTVHEFFHYAEENSVKNIASLKIRKSYKF